MITLFKTIHLSAAVFLILVVLLQSGRGGGMGTALSGATGQIFGGRGANSFLTRLTSATAAIFFSTSLLLSMLSSQHHSVVRGQTAPTQADAPAADADADADEAVDGTTSDHVDAASEHGQDHDAAAPNRPAPTPPGVPSGSSTP